MSGRSRIEWTEDTWNPTTGCDRISTGRDHYYALTLAGRLKAFYAELRRCRRTESCAQPRPCRGGRDGDEATESAPRSRTVLNKIDGAGRAAPAGELGGDPLDSYRCSNF